MKKFTYLSLLLLTLAANAQNFEWVKTPPIDFSWNHDMIAYCTTTDPEGNVYFTGFKDSAVLNNDIMGNLYYNKYDASGNLIFSKEFTGSGTVYYMTSDSHGNVLMAIGYTTSITIGELTLSTVTEDTKHHLFKFNSSGILLWQQEITVPDWFVNGFMAITADAEDNIYIGYDDYEDSYIRKISPDGETAFTIEQQNASRISSVSVDSEGNIYAAGSCVGPGSTFGGVAATTEFTYDTYAVKYSPTGTFQWIKFVEDITCPAPLIVAHTPDEVYFSSQLYQGSTFDGLNVEGPAEFFEDMFIARLNAAGEYQWVREVPGQGFLGVGHRAFLDIDHNGNIYFGGRAGGNINWGNSINTSTPPMSGDLIVLKYDPSGNILFAKTAGGETEDRIDCISVSHNGNVYVSGMVSGSASFDNLQTTAEPFEAYPFLAKLNQETLGTRNNLQNTHAVLYPNPAIDNISISNIALGTPIIIYNTLGQVVKKAFTNGEPIKLTDLAKGTYLLKPDGHKALLFIKG